MQAPALTRHNRRKAHGRLSSVPVGRKWLRWRGPAVPSLDQFPLATLRNDQLREAIRANQVSFPSAVPTFEHHDRPDLQWRVVQLYFVLGWSCERIASRYDLVYQRVSQILKTWKRRAVEMGYIQYIPPAASLPIVVVTQPMQTPRWPDFAIIPSQQVPPPAVLNMASESVPAHSHL
jgi:hypothetical protein